MRLIYADEAEKALAEQMAYEARIEYGGRQRAKDYLLIARAYFQNCPTITEVEVVNEYCRRRNYVLVAAEDLNGLAHGAVKPVRRGRWEYVGVNTYDGVMVYEPTYRCSACGRIFESYVRLDMPVMPNDATFPRYCPNCGALMEAQE